MLAGPQALVVTSGGQKSDAAVGDQGRDILKCGNGSHRPEADATAGGVSFIALGTELKRAAGVAPRLRAVSR